MAIRIVELKGQAERLVIDGRTVVLDDAHHHDDAAPGERHFHEREGDHR